VSISEISEILIKKNNFAILTHIFPDGDAIGSSCALCLALQKIGKNAMTVYGTEFSKKLNFVLDLVEKKEKFKPEVFISVDLSDKKLLGKFSDYKIDICIDHHENNSVYAKNKYNVKSASNTENIYELLKEMKIEIDNKIATCIYVGIATDTGRFKFSNVTKRTFEIMAEIFEKILNFSDVNYRLFENNSKNFMIFQSELISRFEYFLDETCCILSIDLELMDKFNVSYVELDSISNLPLKISGVEVGIVIKQKNENIFKVSVRSFNGEALKICKKFGGGGHKNASGFEITEFSDIENVKNYILKKIMTHF